MKATTATSIFSWFAFLLSLISSGCYSPKKNANRACPLPSPKQDPTPRKTEEFSSRCSGIVIGDYICENVRQFNKEYNRIYFACNDGDGYCCSLIIARNALLSTQRLVLLDKPENRTRYRVRKVIAEFYSALLRELSDEKNHDNMVKPMKNELFISADIYRKKRMDLPFEMKLLENYCRSGNLFACVFFDHYSNNKFVTVKRLCDQGIEAMCYAYAEMHIESSLISEIEKEEFYCNLCDRGYPGKCGAMRFQKCNRHLPQRWRGYVHFLFKNLGQMETPESFENYGLSTEDAEKIKFSDVCIYE